ncbi:ribonuclease Z, mitochondrial [Planococcus citri]|uniref:ribonuclease Z, mitochondrial n=1 Tax=Planococcus citri TaxID=170843 RepID=UPI0031F7CA25
MRAYLSHVLCQNCVYNGTHSFKSIRQLIPVFAMPKNRTYLPDLQKNRIKMREKKTKYTSGTAYLQILGSGCRGGAKSIYFFTDFCRYMFNCGEGTQRLAHEHKIKIARLEHIFITNPSWENIGGLPGLALTVQEVGVPDLTLHGPAGLECLFASTNRFVVLYDLSIKMAECSKDSLYEDPAVTVYYVPLFSNESNKDDETGEYSTLLNRAKSSKDDIDYYAHMKRQNQHRGKSPQKFTESSTTTKFTSTSMSYICKLKPKLGTLNLDLCVERNVPPGPLLGKLKNGEDIVLADGTKVKSSDVKDPDSPGPVFIIMDCPSEDYLECLLNEERFKEYQTGAAEEDIPKYVLHFTPSRVMETERYQTWMKRFPESVLHVNVNDSNNCMGNIGPHVLQRQLNYLDEDIFPLLADKSIPIVDVPLNKKVSLDPDDILKRCAERVAEQSNPKEVFVPAEKLNIPAHVGHTLKTLDLRDVKKMETQFPHCVYMNPQSIIEDLYVIESFKSEYDKLKSDLAAVSEQVKSENEKNPFPIITFLGTGSSVPNKSRNTSGILVTFSDDNHIILDCGEGTYGQLVRFFGADEADRVLASTKAIYVSHLHADHHIGAIMLLQKRREAVRKLNAGLKKVYFLAPEQILFWFYSYHFHFESILDCFELIGNQDLLSDDKKIPELEELLKVLNAKEIKTCKARHCPHSFGVSITDSNGKKITYSGDTMPTTNLVELGKDSDLLIHEATFEDDLAHEAKMKMHSTASEAIAVGKQMNAKFTILTHFSQRYYKIPVITEHFDDKVGMAFDNMRVRFGDFKKLPLFNSVLKCIYSEEQEIMESKTKRRKRKFEVV